MASGAGTVTGVTDPADVERRLSAPETEVPRIREQTTLTATDAAATRVLAAGADRDVAEVRAELRAHTQALNALRETQLEQGHAIAEQGQTMTAGFATLSTGMTEIHNLLEHIARQDG